MKQLKHMYFEACLDDAKNLANLAIRAKDWSAKKMSFKRAGQSIRLAGKTLNEIFEKERRCNHEEVLEDSRVN